VTAPLVSIARLGVDVTLSRPPVSTPTDLALAFARALERALDRELPVLDEWVAIPSLRFEVRCEDGDDGDWLGAAAATLASRIAASLSKGEVTRAAHSTAPAAASARPHESPATDPGQPDARVWIRLAQAAGQGATALELARCIEPESPAHDRPDGADDRSLEGVVRWLASLGARARRAPTSEMLADVDLGQLDRALESLAGRLRAGYTQSPDEARLALGRARLGRARASAARPVPNAAQSARERRIGALLEIARGIAELTRLTPRALSDAPALALAMAEWIEGVRARVETFSVPGDSDFEERAADRPAVAPPSRLDAASQLELRPPETLALDPPTTPQRVGPQELLTPQIRDSLRAESPEAQPEAFESDESESDGLSWLYTRVAGLGFLLRPLEDLGLSAALAAIRPESALALHWILRRALVRLAPAHAEDAAAWRIAGLAAAPELDERRQDLALWSAAEIESLARAAGAEGSDPIAAFDAWAEAAVRELATAFAPDEAESRLTALLRTPGTLLDLPEALEIHMSFPEAYAELLRAGHLREVESASWLGGRAVRFVFNP
jgi:hypothetical protein